MVPHCFCDLCVCCFYDLLNELLVEYQLQPNLPIRDYKLKYTIFYLAHSLLPVVPPAVSPLCVTHSLQLQCALEFTDFM